MLIFTQPPQSVVDIKILEDHGVGIALCPERPRPKAFERKVRAVWTSMEVPIAVGAYRPAIKTPVAIDEFPFLETLHHLVLHDYQNVPIIEPPYSVMDDDNPHKRAKRVESWIHRVGRINCLPFEGLSLWHGLFPHAYHSRIEWVSMGIHDLTDKMLEYFLRQKIKIFITDCCSADDVRHCQSKGVGAVRVDAIVEKGEWQTLFDISKPPQQTDMFTEDTER